jgi:hypothetical protein
MFPISDYELSNDTLKFFNVKGLHKKHRILIKEIPVYEITKVEISRNELSVTVNGITDSFFRKDSFESLSQLRHRILDMLEERRKTLEFNEKTIIRKNDLISIIDASMSITDLSFDVLIELNEKRIDWNRLNGISAKFKENLTLSFKKLVPFQLDFSKISVAIDKKTAREISQEAYRILESTYGYFDHLVPEDDITGSHPNFKDAKVIIDSYFTLNDLLLGKIVGEKDSKKEKHYLENELQILDCDTKFKASPAELVTSIDKATPENDLDSIIEETRSMFREQLKQL